MSDLGIILVLITLLAICIVLVWLVLSIRSSRKSGAKTDSLEESLQLLKAELFSQQTESLLNLKQSLDQTGQNLTQRLTEGNQTIDKRLALFGEIESKLADLAAQARNIEAVGKNIQSLADLLKPPKLRGNLGEMFLENLLSEVLPGSLYQTQYRFADGQRVDAVVKLGERFLPVDAKFPLESYQRLTAGPGEEAARREFVSTLKRHVDDIAKRYIQPMEKTTDFAMMYLPAEAIYYEVIARDNDGLFEYALRKSIIPTSPGHLYSFLASVGAVLSEVNLTGGDDEAGRKLVAGLNGLSDSVEKLGRFHARIEGSLRSISLAFEKAKSEVSGMKYGLERLREPKTGADNTDKEGPV
jgi:DNA recombination protein RmuC